MAEILLLGVSIGGGPICGTPTYYVYSPKGNLMMRQVGSMTRQDVEEIIQHGNMAGS